MNHINPGDLLVDRVTTLERMLLVWHTKTQQLNCALAVHLAVWTLSKHMEPVTSVGWFGW